jgi:predicted amidohydrolase
VNLAGLQLDIVWENKPANFEKVANLVANANLPKGTLLVLPEMFATGFSMDAKGITQSADRETEQFLQSLAREHGIYLLGGVVTTGEDNRERNQAVVFTPKGDECARYSKIFPFTLGGELENYAAGDALKLWDWNGATVASFICYDLRFPEIFRHATVQGAQIITVIASWPHTRIHHWTTLLQARAIENQAYVIGVNRCGEDPKFCYTGESLIVHPSGKILSEAGNGEGIFQADISLPELLEFRERLPFLRDIRPQWLGKGE